MTIVGEILEKYIAFEIFFKSNSAEENAGTCFMTFSRNFPIILS